MVILVALSLACHDIMQQPDKIWRYRLLFLLIVLQAKHAIANTVFTPSINPTRGVIIQPHLFACTLVTGTETGTATLQRRVARSSPAG